MGVGYSTHGGLYDPYFSPDIFWVINSRRMIFMRSIPVGVTVIICIDVTGNTDTHYKKN